MSENQPTLQRDGVSVQKERLYRLLFGFCGLLTLLVTVGIILSLSGQSLIFFSEVSPVAFLTGTNWSPIINETFGVIPLLTGTLIVTFVSALIALPIGLAVAVYLSEYAEPRVRSFLKPTLEILAAVPTVVLGYFALVYLTPILDGPNITSIPLIPGWVPVMPEFILVVPSPFPSSTTIVPGWVPILPEFTLVVPSLQTFNALSAGIVVGIMIIPLVSSISEDAISAVPDSLRNAGYGLGSTKFDVSTKIVIPAATSGIISSYVLAISRAIGETMVVTIAAGTQPHMPYYPEILRNFTEKTQTMTAAMMQIVNAEQTGGSANVYESMFAIGLTLFVVTLLMNLAAEVIRRHYREVYE
jgi:phosphate transport system permease protein